MQKIVFVLSLCLTFFVITPSHAHDLTLDGTPAQVYFSPNEGATEAITSELNGARSEILVQAYSFTSTAIARVLLTAHKRGVRVLVILDRSQRKERYTSAAFLANSGISTFIDDAHAIAHNKVIIIDRATVVTGSFNFTKAAEERNAENLIMLKSKGLAKLYMDNWQKHRLTSDLTKGGTNAAGDIVAAGGCMDTRPPPRGSFSRM